MPLKIVRCGLNSDSAAEYLEEMKKVSDNKKVILIVPDQYSYMAEKRMSKTFGGTGLNGKYVYTFRQMKRTFLNLNDRRYLSNSGKRILLKSVIQRVIDEDSVFYASRDSISFLEDLVNLISEFKRYCITEDMLYDEANRTKNKILKNKLITIADVYSAFSKSMTDADFLDSDNDFSRLSDKILKEEIFKDSHVWVDLFADFSKQHIGVLSAILSNGADMTVFLPAKKDGQVFSGSLYEYPEKTVDILKQLCENSGFSYSEEVSCITRQVKPAIEAYAKGFEQLDFKYESQAHEIRLFQAKEKYSEVEAAALKITDLVREEGLRYSDIALVAGDLDSYISIIEPVFREYHIPYFSDYKVSMTEHPIAMFISSLFDMLENNSFSAKSCIRYLKTGFVVPDDTADLIENHILKCGIRGNMWKDRKYWVRAEQKVFDALSDGDKHDKKENTFLDEKRKEIILPVLKFSEKTEGAKSIRQMCEALFEFFDEVKLYNKICDMIDSLNLDGQENEAMRFEQVWNFIVDLIEQAALAVGEEKIDRKGFYSLLISGMSGCEISIIPSLADGVLVSDVTRGVNGEIKALFVLGAVKGEFPKMSTDSGILTDTEREEIKVDIAPTKKVLGVQTEFKAVELLCKASDYLYISYPVSDIDGTLYEPSQIIADLSEKFLHIERLNNLVENDDFLYISSPEATIHKLLVKLSDEDNKNPLWEAVREWYEKNGGFEEKLALIDKVREYKKTTAKLSAELAEDLYKDYTEYSISRIEKYFACPFAYFLDNGLKLSEREVWEIGSTDTGKLLHWAVCEYCRAVDNGEKDIENKRNNWKNLTKEKSEEIISGIMERAAAELPSLEYTEAKVRNVLDRAEKALKKSASIINLSMQNGKYAGAAYEVEFFDKEIKNSHDAVKIKGVIDRIDIYEDKTKGKAYIRIIDYKTGKKEFSAERILNCVDLQLMVYAIAAMDMYKNKAFEGFSGELEPVVKGVFYDKLNKKLVECEYSSSGEAQDKWILESKLEGTIFSEQMGKGKNTYFESADAEDMDREIAEVGESRFLKAKRSSKGARLEKRGSSVESDKVLGLMTNLVRDGLITADKNIKSGDIEISPYKITHKTDSACRYCPYSLICTPDLEKAPCRKRERSKAEIIEEFLGGDADE